MRTIALKDLFKSKDGLALPAIEKVLMEKINDQDDRAHHVNSPSATGKCNRENYYARVGEERDPDSVDPRTQRIFDNGDDVHDRIQKYLKRAGVLLMDEVPLRNEKYNIQGHTDGLLWDKRKKEIVVLEIKSINDNGFGVVKQKGTKQDHILQAHVYAFALEEHRKHLRNKYSTQKDLLKSIKKRKKYYTSLYQHLEDGGKYTREEKIRKKVQEHLTADKILWGCENPISRISYVYENKNDQDIREIIHTVDPKVVKHFQEKFLTLEEHLKEGTPPPREGKSRSDSICRWCPYSITCWN